MAQQQDQEPKLPTPSTSHLDFCTIYEPAEDSFLFLDTLSSTTESTFLHSRFDSHADNKNDDNATTTLSSSGGEPLLVVEVGTGSGVILAFATAHAKRIFGRHDVFSLGVDVNRDACRGAAETVRRASSTSTSTSGLHLGIVQSDLTSALRPGRVDILLFNPPYVPTESVPRVFEDDDDNERSARSSSSRFERESRLLALTYAGGDDGMEVTERFLAEIPKVLSARGAAYVLFCARNKADQALKRIMAGERWQNGGHQNWEWATEVVGKTGGKGGWERLEIWRIWRRFLN